ncbi:hypothetical protein NDU88_005592 [Pleurodeles waltl]|uniref:Uncharacterized protein n=1 Tax=Pleurodeles waltl TaxID=8319 RepID=A0AAV7QIR7_PLEWA|nr:hypothetical protein NDU88_005592 [Pleurodeles waltl]
MSGAFFELLGGGAPQKALIRHCIDRVLWLAVYRMCSFSLETNLKLRVGAGGYSLRAAAPVNLSLRTSPGLLCDRRRKRRLLAEVSVPACFVTCPAEVRIPFDPPAHFLVLAQTKLVLFGLRNSKTTH